MWITRSSYPPAHDEGVPTRHPAHADRRRAEAFGLAADDYHRYRPRYPRSLTLGWLTVVICALDVEAGTAIASAQLIEAGAEVLAVEPDSRMARVAAENGNRIEETTFENRQPVSRSFDLVVLAPMLIPGLQRAQFR